MLYQLVEMWVKKIAKLEQLTFFYKFKINNMKYDYKETFCRLHFPTGEIVEVHVWNNNDLNNALKLN